MPAHMAPRIERSLVSFVLLECALSVPFWGIGALAQAHVIPDRVLFRASWSLTPMIAAAILVYRENRAAGVRQLFRRIVDYTRIRAKIWYLPVFLAGPIIVFVQYGLALWSGQQEPPPQVTLLVPMSFIGSFWSRTRKNLVGRSTRLTHCRSDGARSRRAFLRGSSGRHCMLRCGRWRASLSTGARGSGSTLSHSEC